MKWWNVDFFVWSKSFFFGNLHDYISIFYFHQPFFLGKTFSSSITRSFPEGLTAVPFSDWDPNYLAWDNYLFKLGQIIQLQWMIVLFTKISNKLIEDLVLSIQQVSLKLNV